MRKGKRFFKAFVLAAAFCAMSTVPYTSHAPALDVPRATSDNTFATASRINMGDTLNGSITETKDYNNYQLQLDSAGCITLNMTAYMRYYCIRIYETDGTEIWYTDSNEWNETVGYRRDEYNIYIEKGKYYIQINGYRRDDYDKVTGEYTCRTSFTSSGVTNREDDNSFADANNITIGDKIVGQISVNDDFDTYKFTLSQVGCVKLEMTSYMKYYGIKLFNSDGEQVWYSNQNEWNETVGYRSDTYDLYLEKGTYYLQVDGYRVYDWDKSTGKYVFSVSSLSQANCNHDYSSKWVDATYFEKGYRLYTCEKCGKKYKDDYVAKRQLDQGSISSWYSSSGKGKIYLRWYTISDASGYQIRYCKKKSMKSGVKVMTVKGQRKYKKTISKLSRRKRYYVQVRAYKKSGKKTVYGKWSQKYMLKTK